MKWHQKTVLLLCALAWGSSVLLASPVEAKKNNKVKPENKPEKNSLTTIPTTTSRSMNLPPGIQKKLARGKSLPPGLAKKGLRSANVEN